MRVLPGAHLMRPRLAGSGSRLRLARNDEGEVSVSSPPLWVQRPPAAGNADNPGTRGAFGEVEVEGRGRPAPALRPLLASSRTRPMIRDRGGTAFAGSARSAPPTPRLAGPAALARDDARRGVGIIAAALGTIGAPASVRREALAPHSRLSCLRRQASSIRRGGWRRESGCLSARGARGSAEARFRSSKCTGSRSSAAPKPG